MILMIVLPSPGDDIDKENDKDSDAMPDGCPHALPRSDSDDIIIKH